MSNLQKTSCDSQQTLFPCLELNKMLETILKETENKKETLFFMMQIHIMYAP